MTKFLPTTWRWTEYSFFHALSGCKERLGRPVDIFYIHTPVHPLFEFWVQCACKARQQGLITEIGLSNCGVKQIEAAMEIAKRHGQRIAANQVCVPYGHFGICCIFFRSVLRAFVQSSLIDLGLHHPVGSHPSCPLHQS